MEALGNPALASSTIRPNDEAGLADPARRLRAIGSLRAGGRCRPSAL
jgi:hypothetical protein